MSQPKVAATNRARPNEGTMGPAKKASGRDSHPVLKAAMRTFDLEAEKATPSPSSRPRKEQRSHSSVADIEDLPSCCNGSSTTTTTKKRKRAEETTPPLPPPLPSTKRRIATPISRRPQPQQAQLSDPSEPESNSQAIENNKQSLPSTPPPPAHRPVRYYTPEPSSGLRLDYTSHGQRYYQITPTSPPHIVHVTGWSVNLPRQPSEREEQAIGSAPLP